MKALLHILLVAYVSDSNLTMVEAARPLSPNLFLILAWLANFFGGILSVAFFRRIFD